MDKKYICKLIETLGNTFGANCFIVVSKSRVWFLTGGLHYRVVLYETMVL